MTKKELREIRDKGVLKTTKMYDKNEKQIARAVAGAHDEIILSSRAENDHNNKPHNDAISHSEVASKDWNEMTAKEKKTYRKRRRQRVKRYIKQGRLPENFDELEKEEKEMLYNAVRQEVQHDNLSRYGLDTSKMDESRYDTHKDDDTEINEINIDSADIELAETTQMTTNTEASKTKEEKSVRQADVNGTPEAKENDPPVEEKKSSAKKRTNAFRHSSVPGNKGLMDDDTEDRQDIEKLKQLMAEGMDDTPTKPNIPRLNTNMIKQDAKPNDKVTKRGPKIDEDVNLAIVDMGNGCWTHHHFTSQIQTRQYRSPETIIGVPYGPSADIWSLACMVFELLTGDFLFEPRKGYYYDKDDDHLAQMMELLGPMPKNFALSGKRSKRFFDPTGHLRRIRGLNYWPLHRVLTEKYRFLPKEAESLADFLQ